MASIATTIVVVIDAITFLWGIVLGGGLGAVLIWLVLRSRAAVAEARLEAARAATSGMKETFQGLADSALRASQSSFLDTAQTRIAGDVVKPLTDSLGRLEGQVRELEARRQRVFGTMEERIETLSRETGVLANALRSPQARGRWGELTLRRVVELVGMSPFCDFSEQETLNGSNGYRIRPDMIVKLPGGRTLVVDAKTPLTAYQEAASAPDEAARKAALERHAAQVTRHVEQLGSKQYWSQFQPAPELVILFLPGDHFLAAALEFNPGLIENAIAQKVSLATPGTLIATLTGVSFGWRQQRFAENAEEIRRTAADIFERLQTWHTHYMECGSNLERAVHSYNRSAASWDSRVLPSLRKARELGASGGEEPAAAEQIELAPRRPKAVGADHFS